MSSRLAGYYEAWSWLLGALDFVCVPFVYTAKFFLGSFMPRFFRNGMGDLVQVQQANEFLLNLPKDVDKLSIKIHEGPVEADTSGTILQKCTFRSPAARLMPPAAQTAQYYRVSPTRNAQPIMVLLFPATGEQGKAERLWLARHLAVRYGWSSLLLTAPFYAGRKPTTQTLFFIDTVQEFLSQSAAIIQEAVALVLHYREYSFCLSGFSWGGAMTMSTGMVCLLAGVEPSRLCLAPYVGGTSPSLLVDSLLTASIDWQALDCTRDALRKLLLDFHLQRLVSAVLQRGTRPPVIVSRSTAHDHFITLSGARQLETQVSRLRGETQWMTGGHIWAAMVRPWRQCTGIVHAVQEMVKAQKAA